MIVRSVEQGWKVIFHTSHGLLAQRIASYLDVGSELPFWFETQVAIGVHDDLHLIFQKGKREHLTQAGAPRDFTLVPMEDVDRVVQMEDRIDEGFRKHSWLGIMQSKHAECLYRGEDTARDMEDMLDTEKKRREVMLKQLGVDATMVQKTYDWMHFCDRLSLILAGDDVPAMNRRLEIITNNEETRFEIWQDESDHNRISPWPFAEEKIELSVEYRTVKQLAFADDAELGDALKACPVELRKVLISEN